MRWEGTYLRILCLTGRKEVGRGGIERSGVEPVFEPEGRGEATVVAGIVGDQNRAEGESVCGDHDVVIAYGSAGSLDGGPKVCIYFGGEGRPWQNTHRTKEFFDSEPAAETEIFSFHAVTKLLP